MSSKAKYKNVQEKYFRISRFLYIGRDLFNDEFIIFKALLRKRGCNVHWTHRASDRRHREVQLARIEFICRYSQE
ncbi:LOW QUALITY PROTEIN: uncharacterized protein T551_02109 [Pneumocystis jirovecii RU7]|uniref:Uncharacterized protein n=1 Tax=Pneumocystis jirovecii (strain RU7) TaxID=1408657 RepID=A0A0W4ZM80_PNEJ7|nr:LOW QUALITY PROTEIN: uncharacterized protein T551_02109 [Pneumocystis jirovecii RU7]KTW29493.1 LOW QUALITY PROTEIN: hypothetical protein T551_02109 [Pneumocystis jirovecii RU7]